MNQLRKYTTLVSLATVTTTDSTSGIVTLPLADVYSFWLSTGTATGTTPTCDVSIQVTPDGGTTWLNSGLRFAQHTGTASVDMITVMQNKQAMLTETTVVAATGGALAKSTVLSDKVRFLITIGGTNPSFATIKIYMTCKELAP